MPPACRLLTLQTLAATKARANRCAASSLNILSDVQQVHPRQADTQAGLLLPVRNRQKVLYGRWLGASHCAAGIQCHFRQFPSALGSRNRAGESSTDARKGHYGEGTRIHLREAHLMLSKISPNVNFAELCTAGDFEKLESFHLGDCPGTRILINDLFVNFYVVLFFLNK